MPGIASLTPDGERLVLREASLSDIPSLLAVRMAFLREEFEFSDEMEQSLSEALSDYYASRLGTEFFAFLAFDGEQVIASAFLAVENRPPNPIIPNGRVGYVSNVFTQEEYRRQGIATRLLTDLRERGESLSLSAIDLLATSSGRPVYEKIGYTPVTNCYMRLGIR